MEKLRVILILLASCMNLYAQDVEFTVTAPNVVAVGEQFRLIFKLNARPQELKPPALNNFYILAGPSSSTSSSIQIVNGQMTQNYEFTYTYILEATQEGKFTIESATAVVSKKDYKSEPFSIEVVKGAANQPAASNQQRTRSQAKPQEDQQADGMFVAVEFDRSTAYRGQPILATVKIYTRQGISSFEEIKFPAFNGFWSQDVETPNNIQFERVNVDGVIYNMGVLKKYILFPQKTGDITVEPFETTVLTQQRGGRPQSVFDEFFGTFQTVRQRLVSKSKTIKVRDLPPNAPSSFSGAVGKFNLEASFDKTQIKTNEAVNLKVRVAGSGNLKLIETPKFSFPNSFEVFDPKVSDRITTTSQGASGTKTFEFVAIPRGPGKFDMGNLEFSYFDPSTEKYVTLKSKPLELSVEADGTVQQATPMVGFGREDIRFIGQDIRFIKTDGYKLTKSISLLFASTNYVILIIVLFALFAAAFWWIQHRRRLMGNIALVRTRKANKVANKRLKLAKQYLVLSNSEQFYNELLRALWGYISDKLSIPVANLSSVSATEMLANHNVDSSDIDEFMRIISVCEYARYAPKEEQTQMTELYDSAISLISKLEGVISR